MTVFGLMCLFDSWSKNLVVNDENLEPILNGKTVLKVFEEREKYKNILNKEVMGFGVYDDDICVRV